MATTMNLSTHRPWEDWLAIGLGCLVVASPWLAGQGTDTQFAVLNAIVVGVAIACVAALELGALETWEEWLEGALGLWMIAAPWVFGYSHFGTLTAMQAVLGGVIVVLAG